MENSDQVYSIDGSDYMSWDNLMAELYEIRHKGEEIEVWEADKKEWKHSDFINVESILQDMQAVAMDKCGEIAEEYLNDVEITDSEEFKKYLSEWFNKNAKLNFYGVENAKKIMVVVE